MIYKIEQKLYLSLVLLIFFKKITKMYHGLTHHNKIITNNLLTQQYRKINVRAL